MAGVAIPLEAWVGLATLALLAPVAVRLAQRTWFAIAMHLPRSFGRTPRLGDRTILVLSVLGSTWIAIALGPGSPWGTAILDAEDPTGLMLAVSAGLIALLVFTAERHERLGQPGDRPEYLGVDMRQFLAARSVPSRLFALPLTGVLAAALFALPIAAPLLPETVQLPDLLPLTPTRFLARGLWCGILFVIALGLLSDIAAAPRSGYWLTRWRWITEWRIQVHLEREEHAELGRLLRPGADGRHEDLARRTARHLRTAARLPEQECREFLRLTEPAGALEETAELLERRQRLAVRLLARRRRMFSGVLGDLIDVGVRRRTQRLTDTLVRAHDDVVRAHIEALRTVPGPDAVSWPIVAEYSWNTLLREISDIDQLHSEWIALPWMARPARALVEPQRSSEHHVVDRLRGERAVPLTLRVPGLICQAFAQEQRSRSSAEAWSLYERVSAVFHQLTRAAYLPKIADDLARRAAEGTEEERERFRRSAAAEYQRQRFMEPPGNPTDATGAWSTTLPLKSAAFRYAESTTLADPGQLSFVLSFVDDPAQLRCLLLFHLLYAARSHSSLGSAHLIEFERRIRSADSDAALRGTVIDLDVTWGYLRTRQVSHFITEHGIAWLTAALRRPMSPTLCAEFLEHRHRLGISTFQISDLIMWHAVARLGNPTPDSAAPAAELAPETVDSLTSWLNRIELVADSMAEIAPGWRFPADAASTLLWIRHRAEERDPRAESRPEAGWQPGIPAH